LFKSLNGIILPLVTARMAHIRHCAGEKSMSFDALSKRIRYLKRAFGKGLGHKPSTLQSAAIARAAVLTAKAEQAALDPDTTLNDLVRVDAAAARARRDMEQATRASKARPEPTLDQYLAPKQHAAA
jgi:hypothetical protein